MGEGEREREAEKKRVLSLCRKTWCGFKKRLGLSLFFFLRGGSGTLGWVWGKGREEQGLWAAPPERKRQGTGKKLLFSGGKSGSSALWPPPNSWVGRGSRQRAARNSAGWTTHASAWPDASLRSTEYMYGITCTEQSLGGGASRSCRSGDYLTERGGEETKMVVGRCLPAFLPLPPFCSPPFPPSFFRHPPISPPTTGSSSSANWIEPAQLRAAPSCLSRGPAQSPPACSGRHHVFPPTGLWLCCRRPQRPCLHAYMYIQARL